MTRLILPLPLTNHVTLNKSFNLSATTVVPPLHYSHDNIQPLLLARDDVMMVDNNTLQKPVTLWSHGVLAALIKCRVHGEEGS